jgi:hypothetical protein
LIQEELNRVPTGERDELLGYFERWLVRASVVVTRLCLGVRKAENKVRIARKRISRRVSKWVDLETCTEAP